MIQITPWSFDVDWQLVGALAAVWVGCLALMVISRIKPRKRPVRLKNTYWKQ